MAARWWRLWVNRQARDSRLNRYIPGVEDLEGRTLLSFAAPVSLSAQSRPASIVTGDFNGDGKLDFVTANNNSASLSMFLGGGDGTFATPVNYRVGSQPFSLAAADFNGDGRLDIGVANANAFAAGNSVSILLGNGDGTLRAPVDFGVGVAPSALAVGDFNGDSRPDLVVANTFGSTISVLLGRGDGSFADAIYYQTGSQPRALAVGDFNGDRRDDVAVANSQSNTLTIFLGRGEGTFQAQPTIPTGISPTALVAADLNGDGRVDLAVADAGGFNASTGASVGDVTVFLGRGNGTFEAPSSYATDIAPSSLALVDFDANGRLDLVAANLGASTVSLLANRGDGTFQAATGFLAGANPSFVTAGDFNGDQFDDLLVSVNATNNLAFLRNLPDESLIGRTPNERFVARTYLDLLERAVDPTGLQAWAGLLDRGTARLQVVKLIQASGEFRALQVRQLYVELLGRNPEDRGLQLWVNSLGTGGTVVQLRAMILGSDEYLARTGGSSASFLTSLYRDTFGRTIDATGGVVWAQAMTRGVTRTQIAAAVLTSEEATFNLVVSAYQGLLRRTPDANGLTHFITLLKRGTTGEQLVAEIVASDEYFTRV